MSSLIFIYTEAKFVAGAGGAAAAEQPHGVSVMQRKSPAWSPGPGSQPGSPQQQSPTPGPVWDTAQAVLAVSGVVSLVLVQVVQQVLARLNVRIYCRTSYTIY